MVKALLPFGYSYLLDGFDCKPGVCDDLELNYRFLEELVIRLKMHPMSRPFVIHAPVTFKDGVRKEDYPDKAGISGFQPLIESGIAIHTIEPRHFITLDVYSCQKFDKKVVLDFVNEIYGPNVVQDHWVERGKGYYNE